MTEQYGIKYQILIADKELLRKWKEIEKEYRPADIANCVIFLNKEGVIVSRAFAGCECHKEFYEGIIEKIK